MSRFSKLRKEAILMLKLFEEKCKNDVNFQIKMAFDLISWYIYVYLKFYKLFIFNKFMTNSCKINFYYK